MSDLGKKLKSVREEKGISLQEVGLALKISPRIISAIETGEKSGQPAKTFLRGFVKSYGHYLRMDTKQVLEMFDAEYMVEPLSTKSLLIEPEDLTAAATKIATPKSTANETSTRAAPFPSFPWGKALLAAVLFIGIVVLAKVVHKYQRERDLPADVLVGAPVVNDSLGESVSKDSLLTPVLDPSSTLAVAAQVEATPSPTPEPVATPTPTPSPTPTSTPTPKPSPSPSPTPSPPPTSPPAAAIAAGTPFEVLVEAVKTVSVTFDLGNGQISSVEMKRGEVQVIKSRNPITIEASEASALTIFINGRAKIKTGSEPLKLRIPE